MEVPLNADPASETPAIRGIVWTVWAAFAAIALSASRADPDLWGHLRFGLDWWNSFTLPLIDPYSFTQDRPWINHEWLSEAAMGAAYLAAGVSGLVLLKIAVVGATLALLYSRLRGATSVGAALILGLAIAGVLPISVTVRPQLWSVLCLAALAALLDTPAAPRAGRIAAGAALFAVWANLHGGWITGAALLVAFCAVRLAQNRDAAPRWLAMIAVPIGATLLNPYGIGLWRFLASTVRASRPDITEWQPMGFDSPLILWVPIVAALVLAGLLSRQPAARPPLAVWTALGLLAVLAIRVHRVAPLMGPAALVLLAPYLTRAWGHVGRLRVHNRQAARVLWIPALVALAAVAPPTAASLTCLPVRGTWAPDVAVAETLKGLTGTLVTTFNWGQYAIWHFGPALRVSIDGRRETVYSDAILQLHRRFERGEPAALEEMRRRAPHYVWLPGSRVEVRNWLAAHGYRIDVSSDASFVAVRQDLPALSAVAYVTSTCFP